MQTRVCLPLLFLLVAGCGAEAQDGQDTQWQQAPDASVTNGANACGPPTDLPYEEVVEVLVEHCFDANEPSLAAQVVSSLDELLALLDEERCPGLANTYEGLDFNDYDIGVFVAQENTQLSWTATDGDVELIGGAQPLSGAAFPAVLRGVRVPKGTTMIELRICPPPPCDGLCPPSAN